MLHCSIIVGWIYPTLEKKYDKTCARKYIDFNWDESFVQDNCWAEGCRPYAIMGDPYVQILVDRWRLASDTFGASRLSKTTGGQRVVGL